MALQVWSVTCNRSYKLWSGPEPASHSLCALERVFLSEHSLPVSERRKLDHTVLSGSTILASFNLGKIQESRNITGKLQGERSVYAVLPVPPAHSPTCSQQPEMSHPFTNVIHQARVWVGGRPRLAAGDRSFRLPLFPTKQQNPLSESNPSICIFQYQRSFKAASKV